MSRLEEVVRELVHRGNHRDLAEKMDAPEPEKADADDTEKEDTADAQES